ncbi:MAG: DUF2490 domain-containing protein [Pyrinomonadaceae bacterium MAG19_C2-C3]|nr:DUF2490 domain-containing protein [Pyrinomonadaceae bacterium MAG19_C2-C3]
MMRISNLILVLMLLLSGNTTAQTVGADDDLEPREENQYRTQLRFNINIYKNLEATAEYRAAVSRNTETRERYTLNYSWQPSKYVKIEPEYLFQVEREIRGETEPEHRLRFSVSGILPFKRWRFSVRNLIERRYVEGEKSYRYRPRILVEREFKIRDKKLTAYVLDEPYYDSRVEAFRFNRIYAGFEYEISKRLEFETFYFLQNGSFSRPTDRHVVSTSLSIRLR